jgi:hypothetical protein
VARKGDLPQIRYAERMTSPDETTRNEAIITMAEHGITVTEEGLARARAKLHEADAKWTPERRRALREQLGLPAEAA